MNYPAPSTSEQAGHPMLQLSQEARQLLEQLGKEQKVIPPVQITVHNEGTSTSALLTSFVLGAAAVFIIGYLRIPAQ